MHEVVDNEIYSVEDQNRDTELVKKYERAYKEETDPLLRAEKEAYHHYFYESRRMRILAMYFNDMVKHDPVVQMEELEHYIGIHALLGSDCPICEMHDHYAEKDWLSEMEKKHGKKDWKEMVKDIKEDHKRRTEEIKPCTT